jgi:hypothetical protein
MVRNPRAPDRRSWILEEHEAERGGVNNYLMDDVVAAKLTPQKASHIILKDTPPRSLSVSFLLQRCFSFLHSSLDVPYIFPLPHSMYQICWKNKPMVRFLD